jgi:flagellar hook-associated protein 2
MGTVGLSFGSPTSGAGFDVSTTVSEIVSNLQNVETPWKTQLKTLESQDTVISSLGTLFSTLSTDISSLTDATGVLSEKEGSSSDTSVLTLTAASTSATAGTHTVKVTSLAQTSSGYLTEITDSADTLSGSITLKVGSGTAQTITLDSSDDTLSGLASAINSSGVGITASVLTDSSGSRLSLVSGTSGADGNITVSANSVADSTTSSGTLAYTSAVTGANAQLTIDGVSLTSASNTVTDMIPGVTFQLLATSDTAVQVVIANYNTDVESSVATLVSEYNSLVSAMSTQEGNDSSGNPEPLFGSPTLSLLQQQLMSGLNLQNPNGYLTSISSSTDTTLSGSMTIQTAGGFLLNDSVTAGTDASGSTDSTTSSAALTGISNEDDTLTGSISIQVGSGTAQTITVGTSSDTLATLADAINNTDNIGVEASVVTDSTTGLSSLQLVSDTAGSDGTLTVTSSIRDTSAQTISVPTTTSDDTLSGLASAINSAGIGVTAAVVTENGDSTLTLTSLTSGSSGALAVTSNITATSGTSTTTLDYTSSSDINSLTSLGISVNSDGSLTLDAESLDSVLNSDYSSVVGFFQNADSWGQTFSNTLTNAGTSSTTGILSLASSSNSGIESTLNAEISKENTYISAQQTSLTAELNSANEVMQELPTELDGINELYSAITGYDQNSNG